MSFGSSLLIFPLPSLTTLSSGLHDGHLPLFFFSKCSCNPKDLNGISPATSIFSFTLMVPKMGLSARRMVLRSRLLQPIAYFMYQIHHPSLNFLSSYLPCYLPWQNTSPKPEAGGLLHNTFFLTIPPTLVLTIPHQLYLTNLFLIYLPLPFHSILLFLSVLT